MEVPSWLGGKKHKRQAGAGRSGAATDASAHAPTTTSSEPSRRGSFFRSGTSVADVTGQQADADVAAAASPLDAEALAALVIEVDAAVKAFHAPPPLSRESRWALAAVCAVSLGGLPRTSVLHTWLGGFVKKLSCEILKLDATGCVRCPRRATWAHAGESVPPH